MKISIITVTYNSEKFLENYFISLMSQRSKNIEIIIIDSNSNDNTKLIINKFKTKYNLPVKLIEDKTNVGYSKGNNIGVKNATGEYLFFLNPDTKLDNTCLSSLLTTSFPKKDFLAIPRQKAYDKKEFIQDGVCCDVFGYPYENYSIEKSRSSKQPFYCDGASLIIPKETFEKLGGFDEELFMFNEDIDLSWKAHLLDIPLINIPQSIVYHYSGGSITGGTIRNEKYKTTYIRRFYGERNALRNMLKNYSLWTLFFLFPLYLVINIIEMSFFLLTGQYLVSYQYLKSWKWNLTNWESLRQKREWIQKKRIVNDRKIMKNMYLGSGKLKVLSIIKIPEFVKK